MGSGMAELKNKRHERFCRGVVKGLTPARAYIEAGYKQGGARQSAHKLLTNADVSERIRELNGQLEAASIADAQEVRRLWTALMRGEAAARDRLRASEYLARSLGMFENVYRHDTDALEAARMLADAIAEAARQTPCQEYAP